MSFKEGALTSITFESVGLHPLLLQGLEEVGFTYMTLVQSLALPPMIKGRDIIGQSQTGTGKTLAFLLGIANGLLHLPEEGKGSSIRALILAPTRELVFQIAADAKMVLGHTGLHVVPIYGGEEYQKQIELLKHKADIVVATPGRLIDYLKSKVVTLQKVKYFVCDEADRMFDMGFVPDVRFIVRMIPPVPKRQSFLFSATINYRVLSLSYDLLKDDPEEITLDEEPIIVDQLNHFLYNVSEREKFNLLLGLIKKEPSVFSRVIVFSNTRENCDHLEHRLRANGVSVVALKGNLPQKKRFQILKSFKEADQMVLVATDVASRGIHVDDVTHVFNFDLPQNPLDYVHRIGRTARAGKSGIGISFVGERDAYALIPIEKYLGKEIPLEHFEVDWLAEDKSEPFRPDRSARNYGGGHNRGNPHRRKGAPSTGGGGRRGR